MQKTIFSGIQPTGNIHLGNYLGSVENWVGLQDSYRCFFGVMNLHAITVKYDPAILRSNIFDLAALYVASGIDPKKSTIFIQSDVSAHLEIYWALSAITPLGWLNRMTQFKDKSQKEKDVFLGLFAYPVLMACDILLYHTDLVPVGEDQKQHVELTRDLAGAFNRYYNQKYFKLPEPMIIKQKSRIMSLTDGRSKMSKSDPSDLSRINLVDDADLILKKVRKAKTDSIEVIEYKEERVEIYNLLNIFASVSKRDPEKIATEYKSLGFAKFKNDLAENIIAKISPISAEFKKIRLDEAYLNNILREGQTDARKIADQTKKEIFKIIGF